MQPCLTGALLSEGSCHPHQNPHVITLFADATIIPFTFSADTTITYWTTIKITSIASVKWLCCLCFSHWTAICSYSWNRCWPFPCWVVLQYNLINSVVEQSYSLKNIYLCLKNERICCSNHLTPQPIMQHDTTMLEDLLHIILCCC